MGERGWSQGMLSCEFKGTWRIVWMTRRIEKGKAGKRREDWLGEKVEVWSLPYANASHSSMGVSH
jgi:hypothetical protein